MLKIEGKYLYLRAKLAHFVGHLPVGYDGNIKGFIAIDDGQSTG